MNKRIRELLGQAYDEAVPETWTTLSSEQLERIYEKFSELIVKECMALNSKELSILAIERLLPLYQEHFGVEK